MPKACLVLVFIAALAAPVIALGGDPAPTAALETELARVTTEIERAEEITEQLAFMTDTALSPVVGLLAIGLWEHFAADFLFLKKGAALLTLVLVVGHGAEVFGGPAALAYAALGDLLVPSAFAAGPEPGLGGSLAEALGAATGGIVAGVSYTLVWLAGHAISVVALVNPFPVVGPVLKGVRLIVGRGVRAGLQALKRLLRWRPERAEA